MIRDESRAFQVLRSYFFSILAGVSFFLFPILILRYGSSLFITEGGFTLNYRRGGWSVGISLSV